MASTSHPPEQRLFDDGEALDSLTRPASDYELPERFPSFYLPNGSFSGGVSGSNPTGGGSPDLSPTSVAVPWSSEHSQSKGSSLMRPFETSHKGARPPEALAKSTEERLFNLKAEVGKPKSASPTRTLSLSSTVTDLSIKPPPSTASWISASSHVKTITSIFNSHFGTSTSGSSARFPSSAGLTSSYYSTSTARSATPDPTPYEDGSPVKLSGPRQTWFAVNRDPESRGPEKPKALLRQSSQLRNGSIGEVSGPRLVEELIPEELIRTWPLTLEELFNGGTYWYQITTNLLSGKIKHQKVQIDIHPGWKTGTRVIFPDMGNERAPGVFQTLIFVVEEVHHDRFTRREGGGLVYEAYIESIEAREERYRSQSFMVEGLDGKFIEFNLPKGVIEHGQETVIKGEGMHIRSKHKVIGRGDLIIRLAGRRQGYWRIGADPGSSQVEH
ncbi:hypothetical protein FRC00_002143 [Tulasnella sp. 408]|nr:hypothetical protein FRC00_002143 [Tulasnella sp. 408]